MKIYSKEHEYYDSALSLTYDDHCTWKRKFSTIMLSDIGKDTLYLPLYDILKGFNPLTGRGARLGTLKSNSVAYTQYLDVGYVLFCGEVYPFVKCTEFDNDNKNTFYTKDSLYQYFTSIGFTKKDLCDTKQRWKRYSIMDDIEKVFDIYNKNINTEQVHRIQNTPVYIVDGYTIQVGGALTDIEFFKVKDTYSCIQDLEMYLSGTLGGTSPSMIQVKDLDRIEAHGFDKVTSFRNMKH